VRLKTAFLVTRASDGNVGIGDSIVITFDDYDGVNRKKCIVIDGGYSQTAKVLRTYLKDEGITTIDLLVATHIDDDHINGLNTFFDQYVEDNGPIKVLNYWGPAPKGYEPVTITEFLGFLPEVSELKINELSFVSQSVKNNEKLYESAKKCVGEDHIWHPSIEGRDSLPKLFESVKIEVLSPDKQVASGDLKKSGVAESALGDVLGMEGVIDLKEGALKGKIAAAAKESDRTANNQSIVFRLTPLDAAGVEFPDSSCLFPGDAELESWTRMMDKDPGSLKARYLKVAHHGSKTGTNDKVLAAVDPEYGIICVGKNTHDLPDRSTFELLKDKNVMIICTGRNFVAGDMPCGEDLYKGNCPRWDAATGKDIETPVVFEIDTDPPPGAPPPAVVKTCGNVW
jgi:hypothetical protein